MGIAEPFDLPAFMLSNFPSVDFGGNLFAQRPTGMRFEIGIEQVSRATELFDFLLSDAPEFVLISQDWILENGVEDICKPSTLLFETAGIFSSELLQLGTLDVFPLDETPYRLTWTRLSPISFNASRMFQGIANREQGGAPRVLSGVYVIAPHAKVILHMYDDRGLDILAFELETLRPLYESFSDWILEDQRHRIKLRFGNTSNQSLT
jgi:Domain of unknown function (DUF3885)